MDQLGSARTPFLFVIDFGAVNGLVVPLDQLTDEIQFSINKKPDIYEGEIRFYKQPIEFELYKKQFDMVQEGFSKGLKVINLCCETPVRVNLELEEIFRFASARYKLLWKDRFVCFSPEIFVKIINGKIFSYPMKGTIDASIPEAAQKILTNPKEQKEHKKVVDLICEDLKKVSNSVKVNRFRYLDEIHTINKTLLQVSSEIEGQLNKEYQTQIGSIFEKLLPAGSICGVPKQLSVDLIRVTEIMDRNFYTGVFGVFDGKNIDSSVLIRFIEKTKDGLVYKSGGGITEKSIAVNEYNEMIDKVYVPVD